MPETFRVIAVIEEIGALVSAGAVASIVAIPTKPLHCATPFPSMLGLGDMEAIGIGFANGSPMLQRTAGDMTDIGAILNPPVATN